ncbi:MAG: hypothetical protein BJ554DRAFT_8132 [Olpidium bornovanus]|uniref:Dynein regulatory complex protein 1/2 N-terminal domain-containing protein n=1 Tax=Olpidium bornovanus TaxID=278681 RepID=A0A8H8DJA9_9FUNG|nr:MAG: hypothetical protein BJ554DRAFT_8132 [Olpidium bornovanus]
MAGQSNPGAAADAPGADPQQQSENVEVVVSAAGDQQQPVPDPVGPRAAAAPGRGAAAAGKAEAENASPPAPPGAQGDNGREARIAQRKGRIEQNRLARPGPAASDGCARGCGVERRLFSGRRTLRVTSPLSLFLETENGTRRKQKADLDVKVVGKSKHQIHQSQRHVETKKVRPAGRDGTDAASNVRVGVMAREAARRLEEAQKFENWRKKRDAVDQKAEAANAEIQAAWRKASSAKGPHALNAVRQRPAAATKRPVRPLLCTQREACEALIANKHRLTAEYSAELKGKDDDYVKELKRQAEEIDTLLQRMDEEYKKYQRTLQDELEHIERAFMEERTELIDANVKELETLFAQRRANETRYMEERAERIAENVRALESLRVHDAEEYNLVKIKLETDVQVLEQQLQQMRATYQLNTEKLDYNFQVLKKRDEENTITMNQQKRKITRLTVGKRDVLNTLKAKYNKQDKGYQQEYMSLTEDYKRITEQFKVNRECGKPTPVCFCHGKQELQKKYNHFQIADNQKFRDVWKMNEEIARELMRKILLADRIIYEQQLGLTWTAPPEDLFRDVGPEVFGTGAGESAGGRESEGISSVPDAAAEGSRHRQHSGAYQQEEPKGSVMPRTVRSKYSVIQELRPL